MEVLGILGLLGFVVMIVLAARSPPRLRTWAKVLIAVVVLVVVLNVALAILEGGA